MDKNLNKNRLIAEYAMRKLPKANELIPRTGYYLIRKLYDLRHNNNKLYIKCEADWCDELYSSSSIKVNMELGYLYNKDAEGVTSILPTELENALIHIKSNEVLQKEFDGKPYSVYKFIWDIVGFENPNETLLVNHEIQADQNEYDKWDKEYDDYLFEELEIIAAEDYHYKKLQENGELEWLQQEMLLNHHEYLEQTIEEQQLMLDEYDSEKPDDNIE